MPTPRREAIETRIRELRESLDHLETELVRSEEQETSAQHAEIDRLDDYIDAVDTRFSSLHQFWSVLRDEWLRRKP